MNMEAASSVASLSRSLCLPISASLSFSLSLSLSLSLSPSLADSDSLSVRTRSWTRPSQVKGLQERIGSKGSKNERLFQDSFRWNARRAAPGPTGHLQWRGIYQKKAPTPSGPTYDPRHRPTVGRLGGAFFYERGTPVTPGHLWCYKWTALS